MGCCKAPLKCILFIINVIFWLAGAFLLYAGISFIWADYGSIGQIKDSWPAVVLLTSAGVLILGGFIGCLGTVLEKKSCLGLFLIFLISVLIVQATVAGILFVSKVNAANVFNNFLWKQFVGYGNNTQPNPNDTNSHSNFNGTAFVIEVQKTFKCCGFRNYTDWFNETWNWNETSSVPTSCCKPINQPANQTSNATCTGSIDISHLDMIYTNGCLEKLDKTFHHMYDLLSWAALGLAILILIGSAIVIGLLIYQRNRPLGYSHIPPQYTEV